MYGYAASSATASTLSPFQQPPQTTSATGQSGQATAVAQAATATAVQQSDPLGALAASALSGYDSINTLTNPMYFAANSVRTAGQLGNWLLALLPAASSAAKAPTAAVAAGEFSAGARAMVLAGVGDAAPVGGLSVPPSWPASPAAGSAVQQAQLTAATQPLVPAEETGRPGSARRGHLPPAGAGPVRALGAGRRGYPVLRMRDRRYRIPRPAVGG